MSYRIVVHKRVVTYLRRLPEAHKERIKAGIRQLEENPTMTSQSNDRCMDRLQAFAGW